MQRKRYIYVKLINIQHHGTKVHPLLYCHSLQNINGLTTYDRIHESSGSAGQTSSGSAGLTSSGSAGLTSSGSAELTSSGSAGLTSSGQRTRH